jgi:predicted ATPase
MIDSLGIRNFKRFISVDLEFRSLTVLTGLNGTGKSTAIQALLLARQAVENPLARVVQLNGPYGLALGEANDVLHPEAPSPSIDVIVGSEGEEHKYTFILPETKDLPGGRALNLLTRSAPRNVPSALAGHGMAFTYLNAERLGPRDQLDVTAEEPARIGIGAKGEYTAQILALYATDEVREPLRHPNTSEHGVTTLRTQVESWASEIIRPIQIIAQWPAGITASMIRFQEPGLLTEQIRPANVGFGFSYALPIIVAGLLAPPNGLLIVENPEAHLHPAGQSRLGRFLGRIAGSGAQVVVETHSDHVVNGIRLAATEDRVLEPEQAIVHFFGEGDHGEPAQIELTRKGGLTTWPTGFFDQIERDLGELSRAKRRDD